MTIEVLKTHVFRQKFTSQRYIKTSDLNNDTGLEDKYKSILIVSLAYSTAPPKDLSSPMDPHARIAPFARRNHYQEVLKRLQKIVNKICEETEFLKRDFRIFVNSSIAEKELALRAGLGFQGKNSLIITKEAGSQVVLGGLALPFTPEGLTTDSPSSLSCGTCSLCIDACPSAALCNGKLDKTRCLQALSTRPFPAELWELWENRLYGCQICQDVCPHNKLIEENTSERGILGTSMSMRPLLQSGEKIKELFRGTVLSPGWITAENLLRNTIIAAGNHSEGYLLRNEIEKYTNHPDQEIAEAAIWTLKRF